MRPTRAELAAVFVLASGVVATGLAQTYAKHHARQLFAELEALNREEDRLQVDWWRLQIEQSTWATHPRIETLAREQLRMDLPAPRQVVVVVEPRP